VAADLNGEGAVAVAKEVSAGGSAISPFAIDVSDREQIDACFEHAFKLYGRVDILVNNAGMSSALPPGGEDVWEKGISITLSSVYWMSKAALPYLERAGGGAIVNVASLAGIEVGTPVSWYCGAKAGVVGVTRSFATTHARKGIRTNAVCPGAIDTPRVRTILDQMPGQEDIHNARNPMGRMASAEEIANVILFLASDQSACINGHAVIADGGFSLVS
jgi:NAD(P)-dependent dehydrogenase (short-subunit alcohol dehydrogenase family)